MANKKAQPLTIAKYNELRAGYAEAQGWDINALTEDQAHELDNLMEADRIFPPKPDALALPGAVNQDNPTAGNIAPVEESTPASAPASDSAASAYNVSAADRDNDIERLFSQLAKEGDRAGKFGSQIFRATYSRSLNEGLTDLVADGLKASSVTAGGVDAFLQRKGY